MTETRTEQVKVLIDANGIRFESSGTPEDLMPQILQFLSKSIPTYDLAKKLLYVSDLASLADHVSEFAKMTSTGQLLLTRNDIAADKSILILLFMAHLASKTAKRNSDSLDIEELVNGTGKESKTIRNVMVGLQKRAFVERSDRGKYKITQKGLMQLENLLLSEPEKGAKSEPMI